MTYLAKQDPYQPYDSAKKPVVPEPSSYGIVLMLGIVLLVMWRRSRR